MATTRKTTRRKAGAKKRARGITTATVKRAARRARGALEVAAHDAGLALRRTADKLMRTARKLETKMEEAKGPAKRAARRVERKVASALKSAGESITAAGHRAKSSFNAARKVLVTTSVGRKPAAKKRAARRTRAR